MVSVKLSISSEVTLTHPCPNAPRCFDSPRRIELNMAWSLRGRCDTVDLIRSTVCPFKKAHFVGNSRAEILSCFATSRTKANASAVVVIRSWRRIVTYEATVSHLSRRLRQRPSFSLNNRDFESVKKRINFESYVLPVLVIR